MAKVTNEFIGRTDNIRDLLIIPEGVKKWTIQVIPRCLPMIILFYEDDRYEECHMVFDGDRIITIPFKITINGVIQCQA